jgi:hypothetical protein
MPHDRERRIRQRALDLWREAGQPAAGPEAYEEEAAARIGLEAAPGAGTVPLERSHDRGPEPLVAVENQGEFPTLTDQGEDNPVPRRAPGRGSS